MQKSEFSLFFRRQFPKISSNGFQKLEGSFDVRTNELCWAQNGPIYVTLCGKMDDRPRALFIQNAPDVRTVDDISANELEAAVPLDRYQVFHVPRIGQLIKDHNRSALFGQPLQHKIGTDKTSASRY